MASGEVHVGEAERRDTTTAAPRSDAELFELLYPALRRLAVAVCPPECDPDDLVQDATARALRRGALHELDHPAAYLRRSIVNAAANERRRLGRLRRALSRRPNGADAADASYPSDVAVLHQLPATDRAVLWLADVERLPFDEVAAALGCSPDAARTRATRARSRLRTLLEEDSA